MQRSGEGQNWYQRKKGWPILGRKVSIDLKRERLVDNDVMRHYNQTGKEGGDSREEVRAAQKHLANSAF